MTPKIYHETVDKRIIDLLESIDFSEFHQLATDRFTPSKEFYVDLFFRDGKNSELEFLFPNISDAKYRIEVQFEIDFKKWKFQKIVNLMLSIYTIQKNLLKFVF